MWPSPCPSTVIEVEIENIGVIRNKAVPMKPKD